MTHIRINKSCLCTLLTHSQNIYSVLLSASACAMLWEEWYVKNACPQAAWSLAMKTDLQSGTWTLWIQSVKSELWINYSVKTKVLPPFAKRPVQFNRPSLTYLLRDLSLQSSFPSPGNICFFPVLRWLTKLDSWCLPTMLILRQCFLKEWNTFQVQHHCI